MKRKIVDVQVKFENFFDHVNAPFYGRALDENGNSLPSRREKSWKFSVHSQRKNTHLTYQSVREKGRYLDEAVRIELLCGSVWEPIATLKGSDLEITAVGGDDHVKLGVETLEWLVETCRSGVTPPDFIKIWAESRCARCALVLSNPTSIEHFFGPTCRKVVLGSLGGASKTATRS